MSAEGRYGRLTYRGAFYATDTKGRKAIMWEMACDCGKTHTTLKSSVTSGKTASCGCLKREVNAVTCRLVGLTGNGGRTHGMSGTRIFNIWQGMRSRTNPRHWRKWPQYVGVLCCPEWATFEGFVANQPPGRPYGPGLELARTGDKGDYSPGNCRWATREENVREMQERRMYRLPDGRFAFDVVKETGVTRTAFYSRMRMGWDIETAVHKPVRKITRSNHVQ